MLGPSRKHSYHFFENPISSVKKIFPFRTHAILVPQNVTLSLTNCRLHHGKWWIESWKTACDTSPESKEILVPVILHVDGTTVDKAGKQTLTPLNLTLGILASTTQKLAGGLKLGRHFISILQLNMVVTLKWRSLIATSRARKKLKIKYQTQCETCTMG